MNRLFHSVCFFLALLFLTGFSTAAKAGTIAGTVSEARSGKGIHGIDVQFLDAINGQEIAVSEPTDEGGRYRQLLLPDGNYRIRFSDPLKRDLGPYVSEFAGKVIGDYFCPGGEYLVTENSGTIVNQSMRIKIGETGDPVGTGVSGEVIDAATGLPLEGIIIDFLDANNAQHLASTVTDAYGQIITTKVVSFHQVRVRFSDPDNEYFPEFWGTAPKADDFCTSTSFAPGGAVNIGLRMRPIAVDQQAEAVIATIKNMALPKNVNTMLATPLIRAADMLTDSNANNDTAVCNKLNAFLSRVGVQERKGLLTIAEAEELRLATELLQAELGCTP